MFISEKKMLFNKTDRKEIKQNSRQQKIINELGQIRFWIVKLFRFHLLLYLIHEIVGISQIT